jgi:hypothetical protein
MGEPSLRIHADRHVRCESILGNAAAATFHDRELVLRAPRTHRRISSCRVARFTLIAANPIVIEAYKDGIPGNGKPFPEGSRMVKIEWSKKKNPEARRDFGGRTSHASADRGGQGGGLS